ncbi:MAG: ABC transporter permease [Planctomycetota bacterium]
MTLVTSSPPPPSVASSPPASELASAPLGAPASAFVTDILPPRGWRLINLGELWRFRELLYFLVWRDVKVRYKQTVLGAAWAVLQPAMMMVVFSIFFGRLANVSAGDGMPYPLFVLAGLLPWTFFSTAVGNAGTSVVGSERLITKIYFPRLMIPWSAVGAAVVDFLIAMGLLALMMAYYQRGPSWSILAAPLIYAFVVCAALGMGTLLAALNVAYRDFRYVIPFLLQLWMFATPSVYMQVKPGSLGAWEPLLELNPMTPLIAAFRAAVLGQEPIEWLSLGIAGALSLALFAFGCFYFRKVEDRFADII